MNTFSDLVLTIKAPGSLICQGVKISSSDSSSESSRKVVVNREVNGEGPGDKSQSEIIRQPADKIKNYDINL